MILLDTCALLWWTLEPERLSEAAARACGQIPANGALVSSISIWEIGIKSAKGSLALGVDLPGYVERLHSVDNLEIAPIDERIWLETFELGWENRDPADRVIVATARLRGLAIVTKDERISSFFPRTIW